MLTGNVSPCPADAQADLTRSSQARGIGGVPGRDLLVADDPQAFAEAVILLMRDREKAERIGASGRAFVAAHYGLDAVIGKFEALNGEIKDRSSGPGSASQRGNRPAHVQHTK